MSNNKKKQNLNQDNHKSDRDKEAFLLEKLKQLSKKASSIKNKYQKKRVVENEHKPAKGIGQGMRYVADFVSAILLGTGIGWIIDWFFKTTPFALIAGVLLGFVIGVYILVKSVYQKDTSEEP